MAYSELIKSFERIRNYINTKTNALKEIIADHTKKILQENEGQLMKKGNVGQRYTVNL